MIKLTLNNEYTFNSEWEELIQSEALEIFRIIRQLEQGDITLDKAQAEFFMHVAGIHIPKSKREGIFWENLYQASKMFRFFFYYHYEDQRYKHLSLETKDLLKRHLPEDLSQTTEIRVATKMKPGFKIDCVFGKNLIESVKIGEEVHMGYHFKNKNGFINTSLTATQYVEAIAVSNKYSADRTEEDLNLLTAILYSDPEKAFEQQDHFSKLDTDTRYAIWRNFRAICTWLSTKTHFSLLWAGKSSGKKGSNSVGDMIYSVSKAGYGSTDQVSKLNLMKLLEIMEKITIDGLRAMKDAKMKMIDISKASGLPIEIITQYI